ncbi:MAG: hypothetical protein JRJ57_08690 [Deltaproteobacteria bacterium]|nr:hypothetical protein [Deltaproteobacteria bacterium]MBW2105887.1 hypothetical protein [Deltaproteobacteria bacterium]
MKRIIGQIVCFTLIMTSVSFAGPYDLEVNVGSSVLETRFNATLPLEQNNLTTGIGVIYNDDDYKIADVKLALGGEAFLPELTFELGFKGLLGNMEKDYKDGDLMAVGFLLLGKYVIPEIILPIPVDVSAGFAFAPDPLCFSDSEKYLEFRTGLDFHIITNAIITLGYRYIKADFDNNYGQWDTSDGTLFIGYRMMY